MDNNEKATVFFFYYFIVINIILVDVFHDVTKKDGLDYFTNQVSIYVYFYLDEWKAMARLND